MKTIQFRLSGDCIMLQNGQTANPRNKYAKRLKELNKDKKRKGADVDAILDKMADVEVESCLYWRDDMGLYLMNWDCIYPSTTSVRPSSMEQSSAEVVPT